MGPGRGVIQFVVLTFAISWLAWAPIVAFGWSTVEDPAGAILFMLGGFGPSLAGWWMLRRAGRRDTLRRLVDPRPIGGPLWWLALLGYPAVFALSVVLAVAAGGALPAFAGAAAWSNGLGALLGGLVVVLLLGPLSEEVGWRGFAQDALDAALGPLRGTLALGAVWWAWHLPLFAMPSTLHGTQGLLSAFAVGYFLTVVGYAVFFAWLHHRTGGSILVAVAAHFSINLTFAAAAPFDGSIIAVAAVLLAVAATVLAWRDPSLGARGGPAPHGNPSATGRARP